MPALTAVDEKSLSQFSILINILQTDFICYVTQITISEVGIIYPLLQMRQMGLMRNSANLARARTQHWSVRLKSP